MQIFDSWASELSHYHYQKFSLPFIDRISKEVKDECTKLNLKKVPMIIFAKNVTNSIIPLIESLNYDVIGLDWTTSPLEVKTMKCVQGNFDPSILYANDESIEKETKIVCDEFKKRKVKGWISNLGHGITPGVDPESLKRFLECVQIYSKK